MPVLRKKYFVSTVKYVRTYEKKFRQYRIHVKIGTFTAQKSPGCKTGTYRKPSVQVVGLHVLNFFYRGGGHRTFQQGRWCEEDALLGHARGGEFISGIGACSAH